MATGAATPARRCRPRIEEHLDSFEFTPELRADYAARARALALRYGGIEGEFGEAGAGECADCHKVVGWRAQYAELRLCHSCAGRRRAVAQKRPPAPLRRRERPPEKRSRRRRPDVSERAFEQGRWVAGTWLP